MSELKPCPFCGGRATVKTRYIGYGNIGLGEHDEYRVVCKECRASNAEYRAEAESIAAWNRRADHLPDATKMVSNADRIRAMTDEELADSRVGELVGIAPCSLWIAIDVPYKLVLSKEKAVQMELAWLQQPAKESP